MKIKNLTIALAASVFALASCKPKAETTEEKVSAGAAQVAEGVNKMAETAAPAAVEPAEPVEVPATDAVVSPAPVAPAAETPAAEAPVAPAE